MIDDISYIENKCKGKVEYKALEGSEVPFTGSDTMYFYGDDEK